MRTILNIHGKWENVDDTTPEWKRYYAELEAFRERMLTIKPNREHYNNEAYYEQDMRRWHMSYSCGAPNYPGYCYANND